ncbi:MAG: hypothetical protein WDO18_03285 [Acidobacteriota bacterium]
MSNLSQEPREKLKELLVKNGDVLLQDSDRCEGLLKDHCPEYRREVSALVGALEERIPMELKSSWQSNMTPEAMRARLVQRLEEHRGLAHDIAEWSVDSWSYAVGVGLPRSSDRLDSVVISGDEAKRNAAADEVWDSSQNSQQKQQAAVVVPPAPVKRKWVGPAVAAALLLGAFGYYQKTHVVAPAEKLCGDGSKAAADGTCVDPNKDKVKEKAKEAPVDPVKTQPVARIVPAPVSVAVNEPLNSDTVTPGQFVQGTVKAPVTVDGKVVIPAGSKAMLQVTDVDQAGKLLGAAKIELALVEVTVDGKTMALKSDARSVKGPSKTVSTAKKTGVLAGIGCGAGAAVGRLFKKTARGCGAGAAAGGATGVALSAKDKPKPAVLAAGTPIKFTVSLTL